MTPWKTDNRHRAFTKRFAWLFSAILCVGGLSAVTLSSDRASVGGSKANFAGTASDSAADEGRSSGELAMASGSAKRALRFSASRAVTLSIEDGTKEPDDQEVLVSGSLQGDPRRIKTAGRARRLNF